MTDFFLSPGVSEQLWLIIVFAGLVTYVTRFSGYFILSRFKRIHPRVEAALEAVPAAVLVTIVLPPLVNNGPLEIIAMLVALAASMRFSAITVLGLGMIVVVGGRALGF